MNIINSWPVLVVILSFYLLLTPLVLYICYFLCRVSGNDYKYYSTEVQECGKWAVGLPVKFIGGIHYKKTGRITKIIEDYDWCVGVDFSQFFIKLDSGEIIKLDGMDNVELA